MKPQQTRCLEWWVGGPWPRPTRCGAPITHRVVGKLIWKGFPWRVEKALMCTRHARRYADGTMGNIAAYRIRKGSR